MDGRRGLGLTQYLQLDFGVDGDEILAFPELQ